MPFMEQPAVLDDPDIPGNRGFDPFNLGTTFNFKFMQEAEIKHCRLCMLAVLGWVVPDVFRLPAPYFKALNPVEAHDYFVKTGGMSQILLFVIVCEIFSALALRETLEGDREPGYFGFDPLGFGKDPASLKRWKEAEIDNGRLAMIAFGGFYHAYLMTKQGAVEQLTHFTALPGSVFN